MYFTGQAEPRPPAHRLPACRAYSSERPTPRRENIETFIYFVCRWPTINLYDPTGLAVLAGETPRLNRGMTSRFQQQKGQSTAKQKEQFLRKGMIFGLILFEIIFVCSVKCSTKLNIGVSVGWLHPKVRSFFEYSLLNK